METMKNNNLVIKKLVCVNCWNREDRPVRYRVYTTLSPLPVYLCEECTKSVIKTVQSKYISNVIEIAENSVIYPFMLE